MDKIKSTINFINRWRIIELVLSVLSVVTLYYGILNHEMWRDELQAWLIARDASSLSDLFRNLRYEGHPGLWHLLLYGVSRLSSDPVMMQYIHLAIAAMTAIIFIFFSPFTKWEKLLFVFGYFPLFEYGIISRNYGVGLLLVFLFATLYSQRKNIIYLSLVLLLLAQTNFFGTIIAGFLSIFLFFDLVFNKGNQEIYKNKVTVFLSPLLLLLGFALAYLQVKAPSDLGTHAEWFVKYDKLRLEQIVSDIWKAYVPLPVDQFHFWNTNIVGDWLLRFKYSLVILLTMTLLLIRKPNIVLFYLLSTASILAFFYTKFEGFLRHQGYLFVVAIIALWLLGSWLKEEADNKILKVSFHLIVTLLLAANLYAGVYAYRADLKYPFSASQATANYIRENSFDKLPLVGHLDFTSSPVIARFSRQAYYPESDRWGSFVIWDNKRHFVSEEEVINGAAKIARERKSDVLIIESLDKLDGYLSSSQNEYSLEKLTSFVDNIVGDEAYSLYLIRSK